MSRAAIGAGEKQEKTQTELPAKLKLIFRKRKGTDNKKLIKVMYWINAMVRGKNATNHTQFLGL